MPLINAWLLPIYSLLGGSGDPGTGTGLNKVLVYLDAICKLLTGASCQGGGGNIYPQLRDCTLAILKKADGGASTNPNNDPTDETVTLVSKIVSEVRKGNYKRKGTATLPTPAPLDPGDPSGGQIALMLQDIFDILQKQP